MSIFTQLAAPFPVVHWRAQSLNREGTSAMALAYIDARDVMARLDEAVGPENWRDSYTETPKGRLICTLELRINGEWVGKSDGAGDTDVEGDKGAISDALKRTAVKWGIGRYLYSFGDIWADCEPVKDREGKLYTDAKGKPKFKKWTPAGLKKLQQAAKSVGGTVATLPAPEPVLTDADQEDAEILTLAQTAGVPLTVILETYNVDSLAKLNPEQRAAARKRLNLTIDDQIAKRDERKAA
jgi:hypothetical protein